MCLKLIREKADDESMHREKDKNCISTDNVKYYDQKNNNKN